MSQYILEARSVVKKKEGKFLLNGIHMHLKPKESLALLGDDFEANQTLIETLSTMSDVSAGDLFIDGTNTKYNLKRIKKAVAVMIDVFDDELSIIQNLEIYSKLYNINPLKSEKEITEYLRIYDLEERAHKSPESLSAFDKFKLSYIRTRITNPKIVFYNENFSYFSDEEKEEVCDLIDEVKKECAFIFTTTKPLYAHRFAKTAAIFTDGKIHDYGDLDENLFNNVGNEVIEFSYQEDEIDYLMSRLSKDLDFYILQDRFYLFLKPGQDSKNILNLIHSDEVVIRKPNIKDLLVRQKSKVMETHI